AAVAALAVVLRLVLPDPTITIAVHQGVEGAPMRQVAARVCQEKYRGKGKVIELAYGDLFAAGWAAVAGADPPYPFSTPPQFDVIMLDDPWLPAFAVGSRGKSRFRALDEKRLAGPRGIADFPESCQRVCRFVKGEKQVYYAMPFTGNSQLLCR